MSKILVTGGAGYIGSHVCKALSENGYTPITIDNLSTGNRWAVKWGPFIEGDIGNKDLLRKTLDDHNIRGVIHLAALSNIRESHRIPLRYYQNNVGATLSLLEVLIERKVSYFVFSSTCSVYGMPKKIPIDETHSKCPINTYGSSKWMIEQILQTVSQSYGMKIAALRYFNAAGSDLDGEIGESHDPETHLIPLLIQTAMGKKKIFNLYGENHETEDGTPIRDFIHVTDLSAAHARALDTIMEKERNLTLNLGTGKGYSIREVIKQIETISGAPIPITLGKRFPGDPPILIANAENAMNLLNWTPSHSDLSTIIETAWNWHEQKVSI